MTDRQPEPSAPDPAAPQPVTEPVAPATPCWMYSQSSGILSAPDGSYAGTGYAGHGEGLDNTADQAEPNVGPIPQGAYTIGPAFTHPVCGPISMRLEPVAGTDTFGRAGFLMHGDTVAMNHAASDGCIVMARDIREAVAASACRLLVVTG